MYLVPLYTASLAWLLLGERLLPFHLAGLALILPGSISRPGRPGPRTPAR